MEDFENKINQILSDPERMSQIMAMAKSLGGNNEESQSETPSVPDIPSLPFDDESMKKIFSVFSQLNQHGGKEDALFKALKPFVSPEHRERMDKAVQIARISHAAKSMLMQNK